MPSLVNVDGDDAIHAGQTTVTINLTDVPPVVTYWSAEADGLSLETLDWNNGAPTVNLPTNLVPTADATVSVYYETI